MAFDAQERGGGMSKIEKYKHLQGFLWRSIGRTCSPVLVKPKLLIDVHYDEVDIQSGQADEELYNVEKLLASWNWSEVKLQVKSYKELMEEVKQSSFRSIDDYVTKYLEARCFVVIV